MPTLKRLAFITLTTVLLNGCASSRTPTQADAAAEPAADSYSCHSEAVADLRGQTASPALLEQARKRSGAYQVRALGPDDMVSMEYNSQRLTLGLDAQGVVRDISCG
jgi:hypothetical protein